METVRSIPQPPIGKIRDTSPTPPSPSTADRESQWVTNANLVFDAEELITVSQLSLNTPQALRRLATDRSNVFQVLAEWTSRGPITLDLQALRSPRPLMVYQVGLWDEKAFRNFRIHLFANESGGLCRIESRIPQPERVARARQLSGIEPSETEVFAALIRGMDSFGMGLPILLFQQTSDGTLLAASDSLKLMTGRTLDAFQSDPKLYWSIIHYADQETLKSQQPLPSADETMVTRRFRIRHQETGKIRYVMEYRRLNDHGQADCIWFDISREAIAEKRLSTMAWKETLGILTVGLAHDFSNILSGIISLAESFNQQLQDGDNLQEEGLTGTKLIRSNAEQASQLVQRIVHLHKGETAERSYQDLNAVVTEVGQLVDKVLPRHIEVQLEKADEELPVYVDLVALRQVLINLSLNAADAMPLGGWVRLSTRRLETLPLYDQLVGQLPHSATVVLEVSDCGHGISRSHLETIFDPFFTTKYHNKGSGLGLYNSRRFIEKQGGAIGVNSIVDKGTTFSILMPEANFNEAQQEFEAEQRFRQVVLAGDCREEIQALEETLKDEELRITTAQFEDDMLSQIEQGYRHQIGVILLANGSQSKTLSLVPRVKQSFPKAKVLLVVSGCNPDEIPPNISRQVDRTICSDIPQSDLTHAVAEVLLR